MSVTKISEVANLPKKLYSASAAPAILRMPKNVNLSGPYAEMVRENQRRLAEAMGDSLQPLEILPDSSSLEELRHALMTLGVGDMIQFPMADLKDPDTFFLCLEAKLSKTREKFTCYFGAGIVAIRRTK